MSSSGGIGGGGVPAGNVVFGNAEVTEGGTIQVNGQDVDVGTPEGANALREAVNAEELASIKAMLQLKEVETPDGLTLVPNDSYRRVPTEEIRRSLGPLSTDEGMSELDEDLGAWFEQQGVPNPYNANTTPALYQQVSGTQEFDQAVSSMNRALENPSARNNAEFAQYMNTLEQTQPHGNIMEVLFLVFRESIKETNEDKKYFLLKLQQYNKMGEQLSDYLSELVSASRDLGSRAAQHDYPDMVLTSQPVESKKFDLTTLGSDGKLKALETTSKRLSRADLNDTIKEVESMQETVRNKRQMASTAFQNFDQKSNQLFNLMASVMKAFNEMRSGTVRNML